jgi:hypothetical protein
MRRFISSTRNVPLDHPEVIDEYVDHKFTMSMKKSFKLGWHLVINLVEAPPNHMEDHHALD